MLTNERLKEITEEYTHAIYPEEVGQLARELLAIREAGDEEVDALIRQMQAYIKDIQGTQNYLDAKNSLAEIEYVLRRSIAARDEAMELLRWLKDKSESGLSITFLLGSNSPESVKNATRILEIVEGK